MKRERKTYDPAFKTKAVEFIDKNEFSNSCLIWLKRTKSSIKVFEDTLVLVTKAKILLLGFLQNYRNNKHLRRKRNTPFLKYLTIIPFFVTRIDTKFFSSDRNYPVVIKILIMIANMSYLSQFHSKATLVKAMKYSFF